MVKRNRIIQTASLLKAVGHPIRVRIMLCLSNNKEMTVTNLSESLSIPQPVMSLHLGILRKKHVINVIKQGKKSLYSISDISVKQAVNIIIQTRRAD